MVKYIVLSAAILVSLVAVNTAEARRCRKCSTCPGGVCTVAVAPAKSAQTSNAPADPVAASVPTAAAPVAVAQYSPARRGLFGWRR